MRRHIVTMSVLIILFVAASGCSDNEAASGQGPGGQPGAAVYDNPDMQTGNPGGSQSGQTHNYVALDRNIDFSSKYGCMFEVPVFPGDKLRVESSTTASASFVVLDADGFVLATSGTPEQINNQLPSHIVRELSSTDATSYSQTIDINQQGFFCIAILPVDLSRPISGKIKITKETAYQDFPGMSAGEALREYEAATAANGQQAGGQTIQNSNGISENSYVQNGGPDAISSDYEESQTGNFDSGNMGQAGSGGKVYVAYDSDFEGTGMITSMYPNYCFVPVMAGDTVEVWATADRPARFLSGGQGLLNHYIMYNGMNGMPGDNYYYDIIESESTNGGTEYHNVIEIKDYSRMMFVFAVQDENGGNDVTGHIKIKVSSTQSQEQHSQAFNAGLDAGIAEADRQLQKADDMGRY